MSLAVCAENGCSLEEMRSLERHMEFGNRTRLPNGDAMTLSCRYRSDKTEDLECKDGHFEGRRQLTCNYFCATPKVYLKSKTSIWTHLHIPGMAAPLYPDGTEATLSCPHQHATQSHRRQASIVATCSITVQSRGAPKPDWDKKLHCYHESLKHCTILAREITGNVHLPMAGRGSDSQHNILVNRSHLLLGQTTQVWCANRRDRHIKVRCSWGGLEVISTQPENQLLTMDNLCKEPCKATLIEYSGSVVHRQYLVQERLGRDSFQAFAEGTSIAYSCLPGFVPNGRGRSTCSFVEATAEHSATHAWLPTPTCTLQVSCDVAELTANSANLTVAWLDGAELIADVSCPPGSHTLVGSSRFRCVDGRWVAMLLAPSSAVADRAHHRHGTQAIVTADQARDETGNGPLFAYPTCRPQGSCDVNAEFLASLEQRHMALAKQGHNLGHRVRVTCRPGYRLSSGRSTALVSCTDPGDGGDGFHSIHRLNCTDERKPCQNPFARLQHPQITSSSDRHFLQPHESIVFTCRSNSLLSLTSTCHGNGVFDKPPHFLTCQNPCRRPEIHFVERGRRTHVKHCLHQTCLESHAENSTISYSCPSHSWLHGAASGNTSTCVLVSNSNSKGHVWSPVPTCYHISSEPSCLQSDLPVIRAGTCTANQVSLNGRHKHGVTAQCTCNPGRRASSRGLLRCQRLSTGVGRANWSWSDPGRQPLKCTRIVSYSSFGNSNSSSSSSSNTQGMDPCPHINQLDRCTQVYRHLLHLHSPHTTVGMNTDQEFSCQANMPTGCRQVSCIYRLWIPYGRRSTVLTASVLRSDRLRHDQRVHASAHLERMGAGTTPPPAYPSVPARSWLVIPGGGSGPANDVCAALTMTASAAFPVEARLIL
ncbi:uncharacterized protein LOC135804935 isoform X2 [Sycon ciliatum]|uniref:uncharacterized protein LOC135804935 isoform X2 n=1 Tax=Sycon ciliatum TaxID=27933 RepID=UPI0031F6943B